MPKNSKLAKVKAVEQVGNEQANLWDELEFLNLHLNQLTDLVLNPINDPNYEKDVGTALLKYEDLLRQHFFRVHELFSRNARQKIRQNTSKSSKQTTNLWHNNSTLLQLLGKPIPNAIAGCLQLRSYDSFQEMKGRVVGYQNTLDGFNSLKLPDVQKFAAEISSIKRNELLGASIGAAEKSLPKIISLVAEKCLAAGVGITEEQAVKLLDNAPVRVRHQVVKRIAPELLPGHAGATVQPIAPTEIKCFADLRTLELAWYDQLVFHDKEHSLDNFRKWVTSLTELESQNHIEKDGYLKVIRHFCEKFNVDVYFNNQACYITSSATSVASGIFRLVAKDTRQQLYSAVKFPKIAIK